MKKFLFIASMMLANVCAQAQLKVTEDGKVGIQMGNMNIASDFCIGCDELFIRKNSTFYNE